MPPPKDPERPTGSAGKPAKTDETRGSTTTPLDHHADAILDSIADGVFTVNPEWTIVSFNRAAERITGIQRQEALGRQCWEVFRASICESACALRETMESGDPVIDRPIYIVRGDGEIVLLAWSVRSERIEHARRAGFQVRG